MELNIQSIHSLITIAPTQNSTNIAPKGLAWWLESVNQICGP